MSEMVERVARAIADNIQAALPAGVVLDYGYASRAAIAAMREPTKAMEKAGEELDDWGVSSDPGPGHASALAHWHVMIDEALK